MHVCACVCACLYVCPPTEARCVVVAHRESAPVQSWFVQALSPEPQGLSSFLHPHRSLLRLFYTKCQRSKFLLLAEGTF